MENRFNSKETLKNAVKLWCNNRSTALAQYGEISDWDVSCVRDMSMLFKNTRDFNDDISRWDVSNVTNMSNMFAMARSFNQPVGNWDVSKVTDMQFMFYGAHAFNQSIGNWDVSNVTNMSNMFDMARSFNRPIGDWDVTNMTSMNSMFWSARSFNQPIGDWDVHNVTDMGSMFQGASSFNQDIEERWDFSNVTNDLDMFLRANTIQPPPEIPPATIIYNNIAATPLEESSTIVDITKNAYESIVTGEDINVKKYLDENIRNIVFKVGVAYFACTKDDIENNGINNDRSIIFGCKEVNSLKSTNVISDIPYINPFSFGILVGLFLLSDIKTVLNDPTIRCIDVGDYSIDEKGVREENAMPNKELVTVVSLYMLGPDSNAVGALHCQAGQKMQVYSLRKMVFPPAPARGG